MCVIQLGVSEWLDATELQNSACTFGVPTDVYLRSWQKIRSLRGGSLLLSMTQTFWIERGPGVLLSGRMESAEIGPSAIKTKSYRELKSDCAVCVLPTFHFELSYR